MITDFPRCMPRILVYEGGKCNDAGDPGGKTNQGVTHLTYDSWRREHGFPTRDVYLLEPAERDDIYKKRYWDVVRGDDLPVGLDLVVFDGAVNSGPAQSVKWLQKALGDKFTGTVDGLIGQKTLQAIDDYADIESLIEGYCSRRLATLQRLKTFRLFGKGWSARIANGQKIALAWSASADAPHPVDVSEIGGQRKAFIAGNFTDPPVSQITAHVGTAAASTATFASGAAQQLTALQDTFAWLKYVCGGLMLLTVVLGIVAKLMLDAKNAAEKGESTAVVDPEADAECKVVIVNDPPVQSAAPTAA